MKNDSKIGVLLLNLGTPDEATASAVRRYLREFLWDKRVVDAPRWLWWLVLNGIILRVRPAKVAKLYASIWENNDSPMRLTLFEQGEKLAQWFDQYQHGAVSGRVRVKTAMTYGNPSTQSALNELLQEGCEKVVVLPLFPQYSATSTGAAFDAVAKAMMQCRNIPELLFIKEYHQHPLYIGAMKSAIEGFWRENGKGKHLIFSFHGVPKRYVELGDPYSDQCSKTARLIAQALGLEESEWTLAYQSRFGREEWVKPYLDELLEQLPKNGKQSIDVVSPAFSADCLETLEEIEVQLKEVFLGAGGQSYRYIPALNARQDHIHLMGTLISDRLGI